MAEPITVSSFGAFQTAGSLKDSGLDEVIGLSPDLLQAIAEKQDEAALLEAQPFREPLTYAYRNFNLRLIRVRRDGKDKLAVEASGEDGEALIFIDVPEPEEIVRGISGVLRGIQPEGAPEGGSAQLRDVGRAIGEALLPKSIRSCFSACRAKAGEDGLRIRLFLYDPEMAAIPWELAFLEEDDAYLGLRLATPIVRYVLTNTPAKAVSAPPPIKVLGIVSSPKDLPALDADHERALMQKALEPLIESKLVQLRWLEKATREAVADNLENHIVHFIGHGTYDVRTEEGRLALEDPDTGGSDLIPASDLALMFDGGHVRFAFVNACDSGHEAGGVAEELVRRGLSAALGMRRAVTDAVAVGFSRLFYKRLAEGWPVDAAVVAGRKHVHTVMGKKEDWCQPVLFMRASDGKIFDTG